MYSFEEKIGMGSTSHLFCLHCGAANPPHARFCPVCGHALGLQDTGRLPTTSSSLEVPVPVTPSQTHSLLQNVLLTQRYRLQKKVASCVSADFFNPIHNK